MKRYPYFKKEFLADGGAVPPLAVTVERVSRFDEVDMLGMVWHGRYASFFEDARVALGERFGMGYEALYGQGLITPIKQMHIDYRAPLVFNQRCRVTAELHWTEAARINIAYSIRDLENAVLTTGYTVQLFLTMSKEVCMAKPDCYAAFCERWKNGSLT